MKLNSFWQETHETRQKSYQTDADGIAKFDFAQGSFGDASEYGEVTLDIRLLIRFLRINAFLFNNNRYPPSNMNMKQKLLKSVLGRMLSWSSRSGSSTATVYYRRQRQNELLSEMSEGFEYTAELLAAGDAIREAIFNCYQNLCGTLQTRGLLRRDFETVREFEVAIRQATPGISDDALESLDNMFEMARYSRKELGPSHQQSAKVLDSTILNSVTRSTMSTSGGSTVCKVGPNLKVVAY